LYIGRWNLIYVIVSIILIIVGLSGYLLTQIQKSSECNDIISQLNREGDKLDEESKVINEKIAKYNKEISSYKLERFPNSTYTQQIENMIADLKQISKINDEK
jgi:cell division protein FtsB